ncbi:MAG: hypothetical protein ACK4F4_06270 [Hylemonella sp.]|uniref:hypothetical protein n=1 Tax=Hylemonella sp. TaxID=2066020 RepID=UPI003919A199
MKLIQNARELRALQTEAPDTAPCDCGLGAYTGWSSLTEERWPAALMTQLATLRDPEVYEPTFEEYHPAGTRYDDPAAPVALAWFPYNRCDVWRCQACRRLVLRYTEFGGYYVDHRVRVLDPRLIVD